MPAGIRLAETAGFCFGVARAVKTVEDYIAAVNKGWRLGYSVRCSPVTVGDCVTQEELNTLADLSVEKGWAKDREEGLGIFRIWHLAALVSKNVPGCWTLSGMGLAMYLTRPASS